MLTPNDLIPPRLIDTDSYKLTHSRMYPPDVVEMGAYFTFRGPLTADDHRIVFYGIRYLFTKFFSTPITQADLDALDKYTATHGVGKTQFYYPRELWQAVIDKYDGYIPVTIRALKEGSVVYPQVPCFTLESRRLNADEFEDLVTWFETALMRIWSPCVTATKSFQVRDFLQELFEQTVDEEAHFLLDSRLHDFGGRGVSSQETAMTTGIGHLLAFEGTDTLTAGWLATVLNDGKPVGESVWATEHSVMTSWVGELEATLHVLEQAPEGSIVSVVADSTDYDKFLWSIVPELVETVQRKNQIFVARPDSGNPLTCVLDGLRALESAFGYTTNSKGYKVLNNSAVIQGDGLNVAMIKTIARAVVEAGYSIQNVAFGMGGGLLQKQDRDTLKAAIKLCYTRTADGTLHDIMKAPTDDISKTSLPGSLQVNTVDGIPTVFPALATWEDKVSFHNRLQPIYDCGPTDYEWDDFDTVRNRARRQYHSMPKHAEVLSNQMKAKLSKTVELLRA